TIDAVRDGLVPAGEKKGEPKKVIAGKDKKEVPLPAGHARVSGKVTFADGTPPFAGYMTLVNDAGMKQSTYIIPDGPDKIHLPVAEGKYKVIIEAGLPDDPLTKENVAIPDKYRSSDTSAIVAEVQAGNSVIDIKLEKK